MCTRSKRKRVFAVVKYRLACWLNMVVFVNHIWRLGSSIEHTESTPKGFEGISDFGFLSEAFFRKNYSDFSTTLPSVWSSPQWKCRPEMEETAWKIRDINHWNENFRWKANKGPFAALRRYRGRRDLRHASRRWWRQRLQKGRQCKKTVVDHTFTETHALRKTRSANPAETKPFSSCLQKKFTWVSKTRHIWRHGWKWRISKTKLKNIKHIYIYMKGTKTLFDVYTIGGDKQPNCKVKKTDGNDGQLRRIGRSHGQTHPQGVIQTEGSTSHQAQNFLLRIIHTSKS